MEIALTPEIEQQLAEAVAAGRFADPAEAVEEGLRRLFSDQNAETDLPEWLALNDRSDGSVPAGLAAELDRAVEDARLGRTETAATVLARADGKILAYFARHDDAVAR